MAKKLAPKVLDALSSLVLVVDPGSKSCGFALFTRSGIPRYCFTIAPKDSAWGARFFNLRAALSTQLLTEMEFTEYVRELVFERVPPRCHVGVPMVLGAILSVSELHDVNLNPQNAISPSTWKAWARLNGCVDKDPKGRRATAQIAAFSHLNPDSDDAADALMIGAAHFARNQWEIAE